MKSICLGLMLPCLSLAACGDAGTAFTGTPQPNTVSFEPATAGATGTRLANGFLQCQTDMTIVVHGDDHLVTLKSLSSTFVDSAGVASAPLVSTPMDWFGATQLRGGETATTHRTPASAGPFTLTTTLTYADQFGTPNTTTFHLVCTG